MSVRVQLELSDDEDKIVEMYRIEHNKKNSEEAIKEIIKQVDLIRKMMYIEPIKGLLDDDKTATEDEEEDE